MDKPKKFIVSHAPFWHNGSSVTDRFYNIMIAALPAVVLGITQYGIPAIGVVALSVSSAIFWELAMNYLTRQPITIADGNAALIGLLLAMVLPATTPWWAVLTGTFIAVIVGKQIFGGIGSNAFNPVMLSVAMLMVSWKDLFDFNQALLNYDLDMVMVYPLAAVKNFGVEAIDSFNIWDLLLGRQSGAIGSTFGLGLIVGGVYLIIRGFIRWEISVSFLLGIFLTAGIFNLSAPDRFAGPAFHLVTGYTLIGAFFLATEDSSSPVNFIPMVIYGAAGGIMTVLIRNIGAHIDGVVYAILTINLVNPLLDKIRPKAIGKVV
jgi:electron transport complex protein RnfD